MRSIICLALLLGQMPVVQEPPPLNAVALTTAIGSAADAQGVLSALLAYEFRTETYPTRSGTAVRPRKELFLASQLREEWLPTVEDVEFVRLSDAEAKDLRAQCGTYWIISVLDRSSDTITLILSEKCRGGAHVYRISIAERKVGMPGIASGIVRRDRDCPCMK
jgi:hypothetical protein